jgi:cell division protein ZapA
VTNASQPKKVQVEIYNNTYNIKGNCDENHIRQVANYVDKKMNFIGQRNPHLSLKEIAVLTSINVADELFKLQNDYDKLVQVLEEGKKGIK